MFFADGDVMAKRKNRIFNIPNSLCIFRIGLIPVFLYTYFILDSENHYFISAIVLMISAFSDYLDGFIARHFNMATYIGRILDPIADKLTQFTVAVTLLSEYWLMWLLLGIIVIKDSMMGIVSFYLMRKGAKNPGASWWGKLATAYFDVVVVLLVAFHIPDTIVALCFILTSSALMLLALILYGKQLYQIYLNEVAS